MKAVIAIGIPGSGKTTTLKSFAAHEGLTYINADDIRQELTGDLRNHQHEGHVWTLVHKRIAKSLTGAGAVIDVTHARKRDRLQMIRFCREHGAKTIVGYYFAISPETCKKRNAQRSNPVPDAAIDRMAEFLGKHPPTKSEGFDELHIVTEADQQHRNEIRALG